MLKQLKSLILKNLPENSATFIPEIFSDGNVSGKGEICSNCRSEVTEGRMSCQNCKAKRVMHFTSQGEKFLSFLEKIKYWGKLSGRLGFIIFVFSLLVGLFFQSSIFLINALLFAFPFIGFKIFTVFAYFISKKLAVSLIISKNAYSVEYQKD